MNQDFEDYYNIIEYHAAFVKIAKRKVKEILLNPMTDLLDIERAKMALKMIEHHQSDQEGKYIK